MGKAQTKEERDALFAEAPVPKALAKLAVPTIISQLINLIYNIADTFFVGRTGNPYMIAAVSLSFSLFLFNLPLSGLFGVGGGSYIARLIGLQDYERVKKTSAFSFYGSLAISFLYSLIVALFMTPILTLLGASPDTMLFSKQYVWVVVVIGNMPTVLSATLAHMLRNVGYSKQASFGLSAGGILNMILDPLFMFVFLPDGYQVLGAAIATTISNFAALVYFILIVKKTKKETGLSLALSDCKLERLDCAEVLKIGIPSALTTLLLDFSNMFMVASMAAYGDLQLAALGIVTKIERLSNSVCIGIALGMLPLIGFNYSRKNYKRLRAFINAATIAGLVWSLVSIVFYQLLAGDLVGVFISSKGDAAAVATTITLGITMLRIRCLNGPFTLMNFISTNGFQGMGDGRLALLQVIIRQVVFFFSLLWLLNRLFGIWGLVAAYPISELCSGVTSYILLLVKLKKVKAQFALPDNN